MVRLARQHDSACLQLEQLRPLVASVSNLNGRGLTQLRLHALRHAVESVAINAANHPPPHTHDTLHGRGRDAGWVEGGGLQTTSSVCSSRLLLPSLARSLLTRTRLCLSRADCNYNHTNQPAVQANNVCVAVGAASTTATNGGKPHRPTRRQTRRQTRLSLIHI